MKSVTIRLFDEWVERRGGIGAFDVSEGCRKILALIDKRAHSDFHDLDDDLKPKPQNRIGYKCRGDEGGSEFIFTSEQFADICKGYNQKRILSEFEKPGFFESSEGSDKTNQATEDDFARLFWALVMSIF